ncbi:hypothetical protein [Saccharopolyspora endophytica]|uniref:Uncharacterized protein n=1 Tax=Saccharopolyspora endophytica TaxID=543886 RepID=A0ABS5DQK7_9PSEU|nr:hypothetical protein [Saccharopolyspora endophytica]MBQ0928587.1 hypothetical protein [Saccharopolyspora endophytica]
MLPNVVAQRHDPYHTRILYGDHVIGMLTEHPDHNRVRVLFSTPTGRRFRLPDCDTLSSGTASLIVAALSYHYQPHQITICKADERFVLRCPTCHGIGLPHNLKYGTKQAALDRAKTDHASLAGHPAVLVDRPQALPPDVAPDNAVPSNESRTS